MISPSHLPEWMQPFADAIEVRTARNPGFSINRLHTGVELELDLRSPVLPDELATRLRARYGNDARLRIAEDAPRSPHINLGAAIAKLEMLLVLVGAA